MKEYSHFFARITTIPASESRYRFTQPDADSWQPGIDVYETDDGLVLLAEIPGIDEKQLRVEVLDGHIRIAGTRPGRLPADTKRVHQMELQYGTFCRILRLPEWVDADHVHAAYAEGYLTVTIPRKAHG